jgi:hypothetical protein
MKAFRGLRVSVWLLLCSTLGANAQLDCAPVVSIDCIDSVTKEKSLGFRIQNTCSQSVRFRYRANHKKGNKSYVITETIGKDKSVKHCAITADSDHIFLQFVDPAQGLPKTRIEDIRKIISGLSSPDKPNTIATKQIIERAIDFAAVPDSANQKEFTNNALRAFADLRDLRQESNDLGQNIPLRNAEYYAMGYYAGLSREPYLSAGIDFGEVYTAIKWAARELQFAEPWIREKPDRATSPPGGSSGHVLACSMVAFSATLGRQLRMLNFASEVTRESLAAGLRSDLIRRKRS